MDIFRFLHKELKWRLYFMIFLSMVSGLCNAALIKTLNDVITRGPSRELLMLFGTVIVGFLASSRIFSGMLMETTQRIVFRLRHDILKGVLKTRYEQFERIPNQNVFSAVTKDTAEIANTAQITTALMTSAFTVIACFIYLWMLSPMGFAAIILVTLLTGFIYQLALKPARGYWARARSTQDDFFKNVTHLLEGFHELKMSSVKTECFTDKDLLESCRENYKFNLKGDKMFINATLIGSLLIYVILGTFSFSAETLLGIHKEVYVSMILTLLYLIPSVRMVVEFLPILSRINISFERIRALNEAFEDQDHEQAARPMPDHWKALSFKGVTFHYGEEEDAFQVGPLDFEIPRGETTFIIGGNGSGKTTLIKILLGLYRPKSGSLTLDGTCRVEVLGPAYRELFSTVFSDFHLFDRIYGLDGRTQRAEDLIAMLELSHKVRLEGDRLSDTDLSQGQRKRLALLHAYLDDREVFIFDEFAADQDPYFRSVFYNELLPNLKDQGKTVIAITHDDHYFHLADHILKMEVGQLEKYPAKGSSMVSI